MEIKEYKIIPFSSILILLILISWFNYGSWIKTYENFSGTIYFIKYINFYVEDITDELIKMLYCYIFIHFLKTPEIKNFMKLFYFYYFINCFVVFADYSLIFGSYDSLDYYFIVIKAAILLFGIYKLYKYIRNKLNNINHILN